MSNTTRPLDKYYAALVLNLLSKPYTSQKAYTEGVIDASGKQIRKPSMEESKEFYTPLHQVAFGLKQIIESIPTTKGKYKQFAVALNSIRRQNVPEAFREDYTFSYNQFLKEMQLVFENDLILAEEEVMIEKIIKEEGEGAVAAPVTTDAIDIHTPVINRLYKKKKPEEDNG